MDTTSLAGLPIVGTTEATVAQAQAWAGAHGAAEWFRELAPLYWQLAAAHGGVRPDVAYAQSAKETRYGLFGGVIPGPEWHNPCGLKTRQGGDNSDPSAHARFADDATGVSAHLDHLALYAGAAGYPRSTTPDPRHFASIRGTAPTVEALSGKWAPSADYGASIVRDFLTGLLATPSPEPTPAELAALRASLNELKAQVNRLAAMLDELQARLARAMAGFDTGAGK